jgi:site-specific recombinase XerD
MNQRRSCFLEQVRSAIRVGHYSYRTEPTYLFRLRGYILFHGKRHPSEMGETEVGKFLTHLAVDRAVSPSTQNQALNAIVFAYRHVLERPPGDIHSVVRAKSHRKVPVVLTCEEVSRVLSNLTGVQWLLGCLLYGSGLRLIESVRLRVKDLDFSHRAIFVCSGKGAKDHVVTLPDEVIVPLQRHLENRRTLFEQDHEKSCGTVELPHALARKYIRAPGEWGWQ